MTTNQPELFTSDCLTGDGISGIAGKNLSFAESIAAVRKATGYTIFECAELSRHPSKTFENWASGHRVPCKQIRDQVIIDLSKPENPPSAKTRRRVEESHHLIWDKQKGWEMRVTVDVGKKVVGKRIRERLKTRNLDEAIVRRDLIVANMRRLGLTLRDRRQKRGQQR